MRWKKLHLDTLPFGAQGRGGTLRLSLSVHRPHKNSRWRRIRVHHSGLRQVCLSPLVSLAHRTTASSTSPSLFRLTSSLLLAAAVRPRSPRFEFKTPNRPKRLVTARRHFSDHQCPPWQLLLKPLLDSCPRKCTAGCDTPSPMGHSVCLLQRCCLPRGASGRCGLAPTEISVLAAHAMRPHNLQPNRRVVVSGRRTLGAQTPTHSKGLGCTGRSCYFLAMADCPTSWLAGFGHVQPPPPHSSAPDSPCRLRRTSSIQSRHLVAHPVAVHNDQCNLEPAKAWRCHSAHNPVRQVCISLPICLGVLSRSTALHPPPTAASVCRGMGTHRASRRVQILQCVSFW